MHITRDARGTMGICFSLATAAEGNVLSSVRVLRDARSRSESNARVSCLPALWHPRASVLEFEPTPPRTRVGPPARRGIQPTGRLASRPRAGHDDTRRRAVRAPSASDVPRRSVARDRRAARFAAVNRLREKSPSRFGADSRAVADFRHEKERTHENASAASSDATTDAHPPALADERRTPSPER